MYKIKHIDYPECSVYDFFEQNAEKYPNEHAVNYFSKKISYKALVNEIDQCAKALKAMGVNRNDTVSICLPNIPQAV
ncbi:MAG TPA: AMP-binding protein, partial [Clostridiales bacterium]|nr:AMP-binding protein [Clostridiales bacterium]